MELFTDLSPAVADARIEAALSSASPAASNALSAGGLGLGLVVGVLAGVVLGAALGVFLARTVLISRSGHTQQAAQIQALEDKYSQALSSQHDAEQRLAHAVGRLAEAERHQQAAEDSARERESLVEMLHPVRQGVTQMQRSIQELERERAGQHAQLSEQLAGAAKNDQRILESSQRLLQSLHSTTSRGHWGEVQLRRVVEAAGMLHHVDFTLQHSARADSDDTGQGRILRPDMVVQLPGNRRLIVDAKTPLSPEDSATQAKALRQRVDDLAKKRYPDAVKDSADLVFCFVPAESLLSGALDTDPALLDYTLTRGVVLVSPASLLASLRAVESAWRQENLAANVDQVIAHSQELYRRLEKTGKYLTDTGTRLRQAVESYNALVGNIESRVMPKVNAMAQLGLEESGDGHHAVTTLDATPVSSEVRSPGPRFATTGSDHAADEAG